MWEKLERKTLFSSFKDLASRLFLRNRSMAKVTNPQLNRLLLTILRCYFFVCDISGKMFFSQIIHSNSFDVISICWQNMENRV